MPPLAKAAAGDVGTGLGTGASADACMGKGVGAAAEDASDAESVNVGVGENVGAGPEDTNDASAHVGVGPDDASAPGGKNVGGIGGVGACLEEPSIVVPTAFGVKDGGPDS